MGLASLASFVERKWQARGVKAVWSDAERITGAARTNSAGNPHCWDLRQQLGRLSNRVWTRPQKKMKQKQNHRHKNGNKGPVGNVFCERETAGSRGERHDAEWLN